MRGSGRALLLGLLLLLGAAWAETLELHFIDVGQGDAVLIRGPDGQDVLYDAGRSPGPVLAHLRALGVERLDLVVASHADADHIGGMAAVVEEYRPRFYLGNDLPHPTLAFARLLEAIEATGAAYLEPTARRIGLGPATLHVMPPPGIEAWGQNDNSVGLLIEYGAFRAALTGDAGPAEFNWWVGEHPELLTRVQVYKSSHHGSRTGDTPLAVSRLRPALVIVSVGEGNPYGHPTEWALSLYDAVGAAVMRTDWQGTIVVSAQPDGAFEAVGERSAPPARPHAGTPPPPAAPPGGGAAEPPLRIECVLYDPPGRDDGNESVTLVAGALVDVSGWTLADEQGHTFHLPGRTLAPGERLVIPNPGRPVWNNDGDTASLFDGQADLVDRFTYRGGRGQECR